MRCRPENMDPPIDHAPVYVSRASYGNADLLLPAHAAAYKWRAHNPITSAKTQLVDSKTFLRDPIPMTKCL